MLSKQEGEVFPCMQLAPNPKQSGEDCGAPAKEASKEKPKGVRRKTIAWRGNDPDGQEHHTGKTTKSELMTNQGERATSKAPDAHAVKSSRREISVTLYILFPPCWA